MIRPFLLLGILLTVACASTPAVTAQEPTVVGPGMRAPEFTVEQLNGVSFTLDDRPTVMWFFTPWCNYMGQVYPNMARDCDDAAARLKRAYETHGDQFRWIGLSIVSGASPKNVGAYRMKHEIPFAFAIDKSGDVFADYGVRHSPTVIIVDSSRVVYRAKASLDQLEEKLDALSAKQDN